MPEVQASVKQIDLSSESADPGDAFKVFTNQPDHQCVYDDDLTKIHTEQQLNNNNNNNVTNDLSKLTAKLISKTPQSVSSIISSISNNQLILQDKSNDIETVPRKKLDSIITSSNKPYLYIAQGDFSIVWPNVIVFSLASIIYLASILTVLIVRDVTLYKTWISCKFYFRFFFIFFPTINSNKQSKTLFSMSKEVLTNTRVVKY